MKGRSANVYARSLHGEGLEYLVGLSSLALFVVFWRFVNGGEPAMVPARAAAWSGQFADWFRVPQELFFHPGHAWAKADGAGVLTIGVDDFAQQLVGPLAVHRTAAARRAAAAGREGLDAQG